MKIELEICTSSPKCIEAAIKSGAQRIEICSNLAEGGTTPPHSWAKYAVDSGKIETYILIRPRSGDFCYSSLEYEIMKEDIKLFSELKVDGVVFGILTKDGNIDTDRNKELLNITKHYNLKTTFHRAIDRTRDIIKATEEIVALGFDRILTSGGKATAAEGIAEIKKMIAIASNKTTIMPGSGINESNIVQLMKQLDTHSFHGSFRSIDENCSTSENKVYTSDEIKIRQALHNANNL